MIGPSELLTIERVSVLQKAGLFAQVPGHTLVAVARLLEEVRVQAGMRFIERGAIEDWLFVVAEGRVRVHIDDYTVSERGAGSVVGELSVLSPSARTASVTAIVPTLLLRLRRGPFNELLDDRSDVARALIAELARRLQQSTNERAAERESLRRGVGVS
jgi:CRP-like cAMP-binding protein